MSANYAIYAHNYGYYTLRGKSQEFNELAEKLFHIEGAIKYQSLLEIKLGRTDTYEESDALKAYKAQREEILEAIAKVSKPRKEVAEV